MIEMKRLQIEKLDPKLRKRFVRFTLEKLTKSNHEFLGKQAILDAMDEALKRNQIHWASASIPSAYGLWKKYFSGPLVKAGVMAEQNPGKNGVSLKSPYTFFLDESYDLINVFFPPTETTDNNVVVEEEKPNETEPTSAVEETPSPVVEEENVEEEKADNTDATPQKQEEVPEEAVEETLDEMIKKVGALVYILGKMDVKKRERTVAFPIEEIAKILEINETDRKTLRGEVYRALFELKAWGEQFGIFLNMKNLNGRTDKQKDVIRFTNDDPKKIFSSLAKAGQLKKELEEKQAGKEKPVEENNISTTAPTAKTTTQKTSSPNVGITIEVIDDLKSAKPLADHKRGRSFMLL